MTVALAADDRPPKAALVRIEDVEFHPRNIRRDLGDLREMTNSIARYGVMQPIVVEQWGRKLRLRAGHRRLAAARLAGLARIPAIVHARALPEDEWIMQALHENTMRSNLEPADRADALKRLRRLGCTWEEIAESLGISVATAQRWAAGQTILAVVDVKAGEEVTAPVGFRPKPTPRRIEPAKRRVIGLAGIRGLVEAWRQAPEATVEQLLDALQKVADGHLPSEAMPLYPERP